MTWTHRLQSGLIISSMLMTSAAADAACQIDRQGVFAAGNEGVRLARPQGLSPSANFALFKAPLAVNTDGAPTSYHPQDYTGSRLAINHINNGINISRVSGSTTPAQRRAAFERWRDSNWTVPAGYRIKWSNVIAANAQGKPCVFRTGEYAGYFGSLTSLQNGLAPQDAGECGVKNQLDQRVVPALVLRGGAANPLYQFGARTGDLVVAMNPETGTIVPAIIGDRGDSKRIGEGSVGLNMALLGKADQPKTYRDALRLDTGNRDMIVAVLPGTIAYRRERPYSQANITKRVEAWLREQNYGSLQAMGAAMKECSAGL